MTAKVNEVKAYQASDGEVFNTYLKAHHRNIWILTRKIFGVLDGHDDLATHSVYENAAKMLYDRLVIAHASNARITEEAIHALSEELK